MQIICYFEMSAILVYRLGTNSQLKWGCAYKIPP